MLDNRLIEFALELARALLIDELSGHVRARVARLFSSDKATGHRRVIARIQQRNRRRLLHRLRTRPEDDP